MEDRRASARVTPRRRACHIEDIQGSYAGQTAGNPALSRITEIV
jgi:hypothetical protein